MLAFFVNIFLYPNIYYRAFFYTILFYYTKCFEKDEKVCYNIK